MTRSPSPIQTTNPSPQLPTPYWYDSSPHKDSHQYAHTLATYLFAAAQHTPTTMFPTDLPTLMTIPLELRHQIFKHVAKCDTTPEKLLRYWFEKREVKEKIAELLAKNPDARMPRVVWEGDRFEEEEREESGDGDEDQEDGDEEGDEDDDEDSEDEDDDEDSEDEDEPGQEGEDGDEGDDAEEEDEEMADSDTTAASAAATISAPSRASNTADTANQQVPTNGQQDSATVSNQTATSASALQSGPAVVYDIGAAITVASAAALAQTQGSATGVPANGLGTAQTPNQGQVKDENIDADMAEDEEVNGDAEDGTVEQEDYQMDDDEVEDLTNGGDRDAESDGDEDMEDEEEDQVTTAALAQPPPAPVVTSHRKWRHIPKVCITMTLVEVALKATSWELDKLEMKTLLTSLSFPVHAYHALPTTCGALPGLETTQRRSPELVLRCCSPPC